MKEEQGQGRRMMIDTKTLVPIGLVITMLGVAVSFGVIYQKVSELSTSNNEQAQSLAQTRETVSGLKTQNAEFLRTLSDIKSDINDIRRSQIKGSG